MCKDSYVMISINRAGEYNVSEKTKKEIEEFLTEIYKENLSELTTTNHVPRPGDPEFYGVDVVTMIVQGNAVMPHVFLKETG